MTGLMPAGGAATHAGDDGGDDAGAPFEGVVFEQGVDEGAFTGFDRTDHGDV